MARRSGGQVRPYGVAISDALKDPETTLDHLRGLRDDARQLLQEQGNLPAALKALEAAIARRCG